GTARTISDAAHNGGATLMNWSDAVQVTNLDTGEYVLGQTLPYDAATSGNLAPGASVARQLQLTLPDGSAAAGNLVVSVIADATELVTKYQSDGSRDHSRPFSINVTSTLADYPDLQVANLTMTPADAADGLQSGATVKVSWDDRNTGTGDTTNNGSRSGSFYDWLRVQTVD